LEVNVLAEQESYKHDISRHHLIPKETTKTIDLKRLIATHSTQLVTQRIIDSHAKW